MGEIERGVCSRTGVPFVLGERLHPNTPSLDQIEPGAGYTEENTQVVTHQYNCAKQQGTDEDVLNFACQLVYHVERR